MIIARDGYILWGYKKNLTTRATLRSLCARGCDRLWLTFKEVLTGEGQMVMVDTLTNCFFLIMQFPSVSERGHGQQFIEVDYGRLLGVIKKENELVFKQDG